VSAKGMRYHAPRLSHQQRTGGAIPGIHVLDVEGVQIASSHHAQLVHHTGIGHKPGGKWELQYRINLKIFPGSFKEIERVGVVR